MQQGGDFGFDIYRQHDFLVNFITVLRPWALFSGLRAMYID